MRDGSDQCEAAVYGRKVRGGDRFGALHTYRLEMYIQNDGNLVIYQSTIVWSTGTPCYC